MSRRPLAATLITRLALLAALLSACGSPPASPVGSPPAVAGPTVAVDRPPGATTTAAPTATPRNGQAPINPTFVAATRPAGASPAAELDRPFSLRAGQTAAIAGADLRLEFRSVLEDSRCPTKVNCIWTGRASVAVAVLGRDGPAALHTLTTRHSQEPTDRVSVTGYEIRLAALTPLRDLPEQRIAPGDYVAEFVVSKASG